MRTTILIATVMMFLITLAVAQREHLPPTTVVGAGFARGTQDSIGKVHEGAPPANPFFCQPKSPPTSCLYYSGDMDTSSPNNNGLFDFDNPGIGISDAEVWVGVKPRNNATVTGTSGNYFTFVTVIGINPTPFAVQAGNHPRSVGTVSRCDLRQSPAIFTGRPWGAVLMDMGLFSS